MQLRVIWSAPYSYSTAPIELLFANAVERSAAVCEAVVEPWRREQRLGAPDTC